MKDAVKNFTLTSAASAQLHWKIQMLLSIVIPSRNPESGFFGRIRNLLSRFPEWEIIIVDDGSEQEIQSFFKPTTNLKILRNPLPHGAGASRNLGIQSVKGNFTIFFDDDDFLDCDVVESIIETLQANPSIDLAFSSYNILLDGKQVPAMWRDNSFLEQVLDGNEQNIVSSEQADKLLLFTNYPWNKIYRTSFISRCELFFSETLVQNDIHAHWQSLLHAKRILVTNRVQATKIQNSAGDRISNTATTRRLQAFIALRETYQLVLKMKSARTESLFWAFYISLVKWMIDVANDASKPLLLKEHIRFAGALPTRLREIEAETGVKRWEMWNMKAINISPAAPSDEGDQHTDQRLIASTEWDACLMELSRLNRLSVELYKDNENLRNEIRRVRETFDQLIAERDILRAERDILLAERDVLATDNVGMRSNLKSKTVRRALRLRAALRKLRSVHQ